MMTITRVLSTTSLLALLAGPALADLTAEEVLADQLAQLALYGFNVETTGQSKSGNVLTVDGLTASGAIPDEEMTIAMSMGGITLTEQGDGSVKVTYPASQDIKFEVSGSELDETVSVSMSLSQSGMEMLASGTLEQLRYDFSGDSLSVADLVISGFEDSEQVEMNMDIDMTGVAGVMNIGSGDIRPYDFDMAVAAMKMVISAKDPEGEGDFALDLNLADMAAQYKGTLAQQSLMGSFAETIANGNATKGSLTHGAASYDFNIDSPDGTMQGTASVASGDYDFAMDQNGLDYGGTSTGVELTIGGSAIPLPPMTFKMAEQGGRLKMPVVPGDEAQDFALAMTLKELEIDPMVWAMIDPGEQLPRDPATLVIDTNGSVILTEDIFDPEYAEQPPMGPPGQIEALDVNEIRLSLAGAELTGDGALTFNNEMGIPMPIGTVNMMLKGGNGLLDTLVAMGLIPEEQAMGARMMTGMFARPGDGPDTLVSTIEMKEDGSILANGQRIK